MDQVLWGIIPVPTLILAGVGVILVIASTWSQRGRSEVPITFHKKR